MFVFYSHNFDKFVMNSGEIIKGAMTLRIMKLSIRTLIIKG
jgi:hypothetical protein